MSELDPSDSDTQEELLETNLFQTTILQSFRDKLLSETTAIKDATYQIIRSLGNFTIAIEQTIREFAKIFDGDSAINEMIKIQDNTASAIVDMLEQANPDLNEDSGNKSVRQKIFDLINEDMLPGLKSFVGNVKEAFGATKDFFGTFKQIALDLGKSKSIKSFAKVTAKMAGRSFKRNVKKFGGAIAGMAGASVKAWALQQLMKLIEPFMMLLKPFEPIFTVLGGILKKTLAPIVVELTKAVMVLLKPMIDFIGLIWGNSPGLIPGFKLMWEIGKKVVDIVLFPFKFWMELLLGLWNGGVQGLVDGFLGFFDGIGTLWNNSVKAVFSGIEDFLEWVSGLNPANWGGGGGGSSKKEDQWWDPLNWFGPDMYAFNSPQVIGVGDEGQTEYLMREDKLRRLLGGTANTELVRNSRDQVYLLENIDRNIQSERRWID